MPRNMPPPLYAARRSPAPAHTRLTPEAPSAPCATNIHDRQAAARYGRWCRLWCRPYKLCSDLNSQPKRPGDLDLWPLTLKVVSESREMWAASVPILVFKGLFSSYARYTRQTDRQTSDVRQKHRLMPPPISGINTIRSQVDYRIKFGNTASNGDSVPVDFTPCFIKKRLPT